MLQPVNVTVAYNPLAEAVTLTMQGKPKFTSGGQIKVIAASPTGVSSASGCSSGRQRCGFQHSTQGEGHHALGPFVI